MTNNINQQKFTVLLKHPKEHEIITFKRSLKGGREEYFIFSKKEKHILTTKNFSPGSNNTNPVGCYSGCWYLG